ncbi:MAG: PilZ domain-containing protein [Planctomycetota bacterium]|nr:PilZ domain-containing protein [Planctomycetota bacterium]
MVKQSESANPSRERRRYGRFATRLPVATRRVELTKQTQPPSREECRMQLRDFSLGGIRAESAVPLEVNEVLSVRLPPHGSHAPLELTGRVIHCWPTEDRYQVGIEFCQVRPEPTASPWHRMFRLFSMAVEPSATGLSFDRPTDA